MNCKPGDLAVIFRSDGYGTAGEISKKSVGHFVRVVRLRAPNSVFTCFVEQVWELEHPVRVEHNGAIYWINGCADCVLRPIRPQSDDATDEILLLVGKPEGVPA